MRKNQRKIEAKSCPFCGDDWIEIYESVYGGFFVECQNCGANVGNPDREEFAIRAWNDRVQGNGIKVGDRKFCICSDYRELYSIVEMKCSKISKYNDKGTNFTFKPINNDDKFFAYKTFTFKDSSFGKKIFDTYKDAEVILKKLNKE